MRYQVSAILVLLMLYATPIFAMQNIQLHIQANTHDIKVGEFYNLGISLYNSENIQAIDITIKFQGNSIKFLNYNEIESNCLNINKDLNMIVLINEIDFNTNQIRLTATWDINHTAKELHIADIPFYVLSDEPFIFNTIKCTVVENMSLKEVPPKNITIKPQLQTNHIYKISDSNKNNMKIKIYSHKNHSINNIIDLPFEVYFWAYSPVKYLIENDIIKLQHNTMFQPQEPVIRNEFCSYLNNIIQSNLSPNIHQNIYSFMYSNIYPDYIITRYQAAEFIINTFQLPLPPLDSQKRILSQFFDADNIHQNQTAVASACVDLGIFLGHPDGTLKINNILTKAEAAVILIRALNAK